jgi:hypothetical protein
MFVSIMILGWDIGTNHMKIGQLDEDFRSSVVTLICFDSYYLSPQMDHALQH